eukprot:scaffold18259_cov152-Skeletonema_menzelii.AAC.1
MKTTQVGIKTPTDFSIVASVPKIIVTIAAIIAASLTELLRRDSVYSYVFLTTPTSTSCHIFRQSNSETENGQEQDIYESQPRVSFSAPRPRCSRPQPQFSI